MDRTLNALAARLPNHMPQLALAGATLLALLMLVLALRPATPVAASAADPAPVSQTQREAAQKELAQAMNRFASLTNPTPNVPITEAPKAQEAAPAPAASSAALSQADMRRLAEKAAQAVRDGDIMGARVILERAIQAGDATAILALAQTHDPRVLERMGVRGIKGDPAKARALYQQAQDKGLKEAGTALAGLSQ